MTVYRVFLLKSERLARGDDELARVLASPAIRVVHHEVAILHLCRTCGVEFPWDDSRVQTLGAKKEEWAIRTYCSPVCHEADPKRRDSPPWLVGEPNRDEDRRRARREAVWAEQDRRRAANVRRFPMPEHKREQGRCTWCGGLIIHDKGPRRGEVNTRRTWHPACLQEYFLHTRADSQLRHLIERDGRKCADCPETRGLEVDHEVPLWSVAGLPPDERRAYFGPDNLKLRCRVCHKAKTSREAGERSRARRKDPAVLSGPG